MCDPLTVGVVAVAAGTSLSAYSQFQGAQSAKKAGIYQAQMMEANAQAAKEQASTAAVRGEMQAGEIYRRMSQTIGAGRTAFAAGNVDLSDGSANIWELGARKSAAEDLAVSRVNTANEMAGFYSQSANYQTQSSLDRWSARRAQTAGTLGAFTSLLGGASQIGMAYAPRR